MNKELKTLKDKIIFCGKSDCDCGNPKCQDSLWCGDEMLDGRIYQCEKCEKKQEDLGK